MVPVTRKISFDWLLFVGSPDKARVTPSNRDRLTLILTLAMHPPIVDISDFYLYSFIELTKRFKMTLLSSIYLKAR